METPRFGYWYISQMLHGAGIFTIYPKNAKKKIGIFFIDGASGYVTCFFNMVCVLIKGDAHSTEP